MNEINVDLLVIGNVSCSKYAMTGVNGGITGMGNAVMEADNIPEHVIVEGKKYILSDAIIMKAKDFEVNIESLLSLRKHILVTGIVKECC